jgi:hypothetical protein
VIGLSIQWDGRVGEGDCERTYDFGAYCRIPKVRNDGDERTSQQSELIHFAIKHGIVAI